jgi:hypothetical protein
MSGLVRARKPDRHWGAKMVLIGEAGPDRAAIAGLTCRRGSGAIKGIINHQLVAFSTQFGGRQSFHVQYPAVGENALHNSRSND